MDFFIFHEPHLLCSHVNQSSVKKEFFRSTQSLASQLTRPYRGPRQAQIVLFRGDTSGEYVQFELPTAQTCSFLQRQPLMLGVARPGCSMPLISASVLYNSVGFPYISLLD